MKSYETIDKEMMDIINKKCEYSGLVMEWWAEFGEINYENDKLIIEALYTNNDPEHKEYDEKQEKKIRDIAQEIHTRGDLQALQANYSIMCNFMNENDDSKHKWHMMNLNAMLHGVGDWLC